VLAWPYTFVDGCKSFAFLLLHRARRSQVLADRQTAANNSRMYSTWLAELFAAAE
jgi:hypothetical protein